MYACPSMCLQDARLQDALASRIMGVSLLLLQAEEKLHVAVLSILPKGDLDM